jgi:UDP-glucose 4-epimerase
MRPAGAVLLTGGAGYIGAHAAWALVDAGREVVVLDDLSTGVRANLPAEAEFLLGDVGDEALLDELFARRAITDIVHFAGSIVVPESVTDPAKYYTNNTVKTLALLRAVMKAKIPRLVFSSTAAVYGAPEIVPITEDMPLIPTNPYGTSKMMSERMIFDIGRAAGFSAVCLRYFNVAGADPAGRTGQSTPRATHLIKVAAEAATGKREGISVFGTDYPTPDNTCVRDYIHVSDLVTAHLLALDYLANGGASVALNCGYGHGFSVTEVLDVMDQVAKQPIPRAFAGRRAGDPPALVADSTRLRAAFGWMPAHDDLTEIVTSALAWERRLG